jgi:hypothetical protein
VRISCPLDIIERENGYLQITVKLAVSKVVAKNGASVETSHLYCPELSRTRSFNRIDFWLFDFSLLDLFCE